MLITVQKVKPGDLITASAWNAVVDTLFSLRSEIDAIGVGSPPTSTGPKPVITSTEPTPDVPAGSTLTIHGQNFEVPAILNTVTLDGAALGDFPPGSTDQILKVQIPGDLTGLPKTMELVLTTTAGDAHTSIHVVPAVVTLIGQIRVTNATGILPTPNVGDTLHFQFTLDADAVNVAEQYHVRADFSNAVGSSVSEWQAGTSYVGLTGDEIGGLRGRGVIE